jgi:ribosome-binding protein aMBF1 (putative translation factor)
MSKDTPATTGVSPFQLPEKIRRDAMREHLNRNVADGSAQRIVEADRASTLLQRDRLLAGRSLESMARKLGVSPSRLEAFECGMATPTAIEAVKIERTLHAKADVMLLPPTGDNISRLAGRY